MAIFKHCALFLALALTSQSALAFPDKLLEEWPKTNLNQSTLDSYHLASLDKPKDGIKSIDKPLFANISEIKNIESTEPVITIESGNEAKTYPLRIMIWHEVVNDDFSGKNIAVTYSPLSNTSIIYDRGENEFGITGQTYKSNSILYDRKTQSWWQQYSGEAIAGEQKGSKLTVVTSRLESFASYKKRFPEGKILLPPVNSTLPYGTNPYIAYDTSFPFFYKGKYNGQLPAMTYMIVADGQAWPLPPVMIRGYAVTGDIVIKWTPGQNSALSSGEISLGNDVGNIIVQKRSDNGTFHDIPYVLTFAFIYQAFNPDGVINF